MNEYVKWGIVALIGAGLVALDIRTFVPRENSELKDDVPNAEKS